MTFIVQNTYLTDYARGFPGMLADGSTQNRISRTVEDSAGIGFGKACFQGATDHGVTATPGTKFMGVTIADVGVIPFASGGPIASDTFPQGATASLLDMGNIFVTAAVSVTPEQPVYVTSAGLFTNVASGNTAIPAYFRETASAGAPVRMHIVQQ